MKKEGSFLLAVSGGIDSMVMAHLFVGSPYKKIVILHCNFMLRGIDSDKDEALVRGWALEHQIPFFVKRFDTAGYAADKKISIEMAARFLRYQWFQELRQELGFDWIAVAHHANDHAETTLLNLIRGSGIRGVCGISSLQGNIVRPMLGFCREQIEAYAHKQKIPFREDVTNAQLDIPRNRIRHAVVPELAKINSGVVARMRENGIYLQQARDILLELTYIKRELWCRQDGEALLFDIELIKKDKHIAFWMFELLYPFGFETGGINQIVNLLHGRTGQKVMSYSHILYKDRDYLALVPKDTTLPPNFTVTQHESSGYKIIPNQKIAALDADKLQLPLSIRLWKEGDRFIPLGMKGFKKVSDFLIDVKIPLWKKERQYVLCCGADIVWVEGQRIDDRYKVTAATKQVAEIKISQNCNE
ncbi:MAG: tRNA lysidine(34) synthetase TilS [Prevotellaceae bacterium]|nr:tRNA lysidine(34) synthetase TilS [Prevotellaceae bacterium]